MSESRYYIRAEYCYSRGTFGAPEDGVWHDPETGQQVWETREEAKKMVDKIDNNTYYFNHGEQGRPNLKVRKIRPNQDIKNYCGN